MSSTDPLRIEGYPHRIRLHRSGECGECPNGTPQHVLHRPVGECDTCYEQTWNPETIGMACINRLNPALPMPCNGEFVRRIGW